MTSKDAFMIVNLLIEASSNYYWQVLGSYSFICWEASCGSSSMKELTQALATCNIHIALALAPYPLALAPYPLALAPSPSPLSPS